MKRVILGFIALVGAGMIYFALKPECAGVTFVDEAACRGTFNALTCGALFRKAEGKAREDYAPFPDQDSCLRRFPYCMPHASVIGGYVPRPSGVCITKSPETMDAVPLYRRIGQ